MQPTVITQDTNATIADLLNVTVNHNSLKLEIDGSNTKYINKTAIYQVRFTYETRPENRIKREQNNIVTETYIVFYVDSDVPQIDIEGSWTEFYYKNQKNSRFKMDPPSKEMIDESDLSEQ